MNDHNTIYIQNVHYWLTHMPVVACVCLEFSMAFFSKADQTTEALF